MGKTSFIDPRIFSMDLKGAKEMTDYGTGVGVNTGSAYFELLSGPDLVMDELITRLNTAYLWYDPSYGFDLSSYEGSSQAWDDVAMLCSKVETQLKRDTRVATAVATGTASGEALSLSILVTLSGGESFALVGALSSLSPSQFTFAQG